MASEGEGRGTDGRWSFLVILIAISAAFALVLWPFLTAILWAVIAAILFTPVYRRLLARMPGWRNSAALLTLLGDAGAAKELGTPLGRAMSSFLAAVIGTGLQWRDTAQLWMPAFQARIAVVRQRSYEGGNNLFMTTDDIASLALRGVVAGMRLRRRFASDAQWERQQWLRLRVAAESLAGFSDRLRVSLREQAYARLIPTPGAGEPWDVLDAIRDQLAGHADPNPPVAPPEAPDPAVYWYRPETSAFFDELGTLLEPAKHSEPQSGVLRDGAPRPFAELRQVPRD